MNDDIKTLRYFSGGQWLASDSEKTMDVYDPSTGAVIARTPCCTAAEVEQAVQSAAKAFPAWAATPVSRRVQIFFKLRALLSESLPELTWMLAREQGKVLAEARGDVLKALEATDLACSMPTMMMGESLMDVTHGYDTTTYREPLGVFAGIAPFNFPAMIPMGWMAPLCLASGNTMVIKAASMTPMTSLRIAELYQQAGLPDGVLNIVTCSRAEADLLLRHPQVRGVTFVGSTSVGRHVYETCAAHGTRVQALCEAKNHALVLDDAPVIQTARGIINAYCGCAGERCMALSVVVAQRGIADALVKELVRLSKALRVGPAYAPESQLGPLISAEHRSFVSDWIARGQTQGARLALDGRGTIVPGWESGFYLGPTILDDVTPDMDIGDSEIFGPVLCVKRVDSFDQGVTLINANPFANGAVIYTRSGREAREFARRIDGGMVGINVGVPVPLAAFSFTGNKLSFFGDLHTLGRDGVRFYTRAKTVTAHWFDDESGHGPVGTWD